MHLIKQVIKYSNMMYIPNGNVIYSPTINAQPP